jgi:DNA-binding transcriptional regulator PaaX
MLDGILIFFTKNFPSKETFVRSILTRMTARGRTYKEWMTPRTPMRILVHPKV